MSAAHSKAVGPHKRETDGLALTPSAPHWFAPIRSSQGASDRNQEKLPSSTGRRVRNRSDHQSHTLTSPQARLRDNGTAVRRFPPRHLSGKSRRMVDRCWRARFPLK
jgi:hypothetical protein